MEISSLKGEGLVELFQAAARIGGEYAELEKAKENKCLKCRLL